MNVPLPVRMLKTAWFPLNRRKPLNANLLGYTIKQQRGKNKMNEDGKGWIRLTRIVKDELEQFRPGGGGGYSRIRA